MKKLAVPLVFCLLFSSMMLHGGIGNNNVGLIPYDGEAKIYGRLARSEMQGAFSDAGLLGFCDGRLRLRKGKRFEYNRSSYLAASCPDYIVYKSQSGVQGIIYSLLNKFYKNPVIFRALCAFFLSAVLTAWYVWLSGYFGFILSFLVIIGILSFRGLMIYGDNIAQVLGATFLIMVAMFWAYEKKLKQLGTVAFMVILFKFLLNGPEYLFAAVLLPFLPLVFFAVLGNFSTVRIMKDFCLIMNGVIGGCFVSILILMIQVSLLDSPTGAISFFIQKALARTNNPDLLPWDEKTVTISCTWVGLLKEYLSFPCISMAGIRISFGMMMLLMGGISILTVYLYRRHKQRPLLALLVTAWASVLCPVAWILIAKGHSASHTNVDPLVWHMPFTLLGMALIIVTLKTWIDPKLPQ